MIIKAAALGKTEAPANAEMGDLLFSSPTDAAIAKLLPALPETSPAVKLIRAAAEDFNALNLTSEVKVAVALNLVAILAANLVVDGAPRGKVVNALPEELRKKLQTALPFKLT